MTFDRSIRLGVVALIGAVLAAACSQPPPYEPNSSVAVTTNTPRPAEPFAPASDPVVGGTAPGSLLSYDDFPTVAPQILETGATAQRIRYVSTSGVGAGTTEVTGTVFVPPGTPPDDGWRVIAYGHGNTGINFDCGPSLYDDLLNQWLPITALLLNGYMVVMSDYEGLGGPGAHPFLDARTLGYNMIDAVRAGRNLVPAAGSRWAAFGGSLGGLATWAAHDVEPEYGAGLELVGAAAWVPVADVSDLPAKAAAGTMTRDQLHLYFLAIMGLKRTDHPELDLSQYMRGDIAANQDVLILCNGPRVPDAIAVLQNANPADLVPASPEAQAVMERLLKDRSVNEHVPGSPMLVMYALDDELVDSAWTERVLAEACTSGGDIEFEARPGEGHGTIDASRAFAWVGARFDGQSSRTDCTEG